MKIPQEVLREISNCPFKAERKRLIRQASGMYKVSEATVYRAVQKYEHRSKTVRFSDGEIEAARDILSLKYKSRGLKHQRISTEMAIAEVQRRAEIAGREPPKKLNRARIDEIARTLGVDERHLRMARPCVRLTTPGPNTWGQADFTVAQCFYLKNMRVHFRNVKFHSKKEPKQKIILGTYVEMYSTAKYWFAFEALGENTLIATDFLYRAFEKKGADFPMYGLPWNLYVDQGSPFKSGHFKALLARLGIELHLHMPGNARATGMAEKSVQQTQRMESLIRTRINERDWPSLDDFNRWLYEFSIDENNKKRRGDTKTRFEKWLEIHPEDLRSCPPREIFMNLTATHETQRRVHPELCIYHGGKPYWVGVPDLCGEQVDVFINVDGRVWIHHPFVGYMGPLEEGVHANVMGQDFERPQKTFWEKEKQELQRIIDDEGISSTPGQHYSRQSDKVHPEPVSADQVKAQGAEPAPDQKLSITEAKMKISQEIGIPLGQLPESTQSLIQEVLTSQASETEGTVPGDIVREVCDRIKEIMFVEEEFPGDAPGDIDGAS